MQDFENAVVAPTPGGAAAGGKAALNATATAAPTPRRALGELKTNANALLTPAAAPLVAHSHPHQQQQKMQTHAPLQRPTGKPPVAPQTQQQKKAISNGVTVQTAGAIAAADAAAAAPPNLASLRLPPVERPAGMTLDQQLAADELRAQRLAHGAAQAICAGVPLSLSALSGGGRYTSSSSKKRVLGPAAAAAAAARTFTVFDDDDDDDEVCCRPSSAPSTPPAESSFMGDEERDFAPSPPSLDDALASLELCADRFEGGGGGGGGAEDDESGSDGGESGGGRGRRGGGESDGASAWAVSPPRYAASGEAEAQ